jgi:quinoprotein glucose dehydrogenase
MKRLIGFIAIIALALPMISPAGEEGEIDWPAYGRDVQGTRYLPAGSITRENVHRLELAWTYRTGETGPEYTTRKPASFQATPILVDSVLYLSTPLGRVIALEPDSGKEKWAFDPRIRRDVTYGDFANRGLSTWRDPAADAEAACARRLYIATAQSQLIALDARSGERCPGFGKNGEVNLRKGLRIPPFENQAYTMTSPPVVANGLVVVGSSIGDNSRSRTTRPPLAASRQSSARTGRTRGPSSRCPRRRALRCQCRARAGSAA